MWEKTEGVIKNWQSREKETLNTRQTKQKTPHGPRENTGVNPDARDGKAVPVPYS